MRRRNGAEMKKEWYKCSWIKGILIGVAHVMAVILIISMLWILACPSAAVNMIDGRNAEYRDSDEFVATFANACGDILFGLEAKSQFEKDGAFDGDKVVDILNYSSGYPIDGKNEHGLAYKLSDLVQWQDDYYNGEVEESDFGSTDENPIIVCKKQDGSYEYFYYRDLKKKIAEGELHFVEQNEEQESGEMLEALQNGELFQGYSDYRLAIVDKDNTLQYVDCWNYDGSWIEEEYAPIGAKDVLEIANSDPVWNGNLGQAYSAIRDTLTILSSELDYYENTLPSYDEDRSNLTYLYLDKDTKTVYGNWEGCQDYAQAADGIEEIRKMDRYILLTPKSVEFETNIPNVSYEDIYYHSQLTAESQDFVFAVGIDMNYPVHDVFYYQGRSYDYYQGGSGMAVIGACVSSVLLIVCMIWLTIVAGRKPEDKDVHLNVFDHWPTEIGAGFVIGVWVLCYCVAIYVFDELSDRIDALSSWAPVTNMVNIVSCSIFGVVTCALFLMGYLSLVRRMKAKILWKNSALRWIGKKCIGFLKLIPMVWRHVLVMTGFILTQVFWACGSGFEIVAAIADIAAFVYVLWQAAGRKEIAKGIRNIAEGQVDYKIPLTGLRGTQREVAENINRIGEGLDAAVEAGMRTERLKTDLITNVSHDIKTPLTSIINYIDLLKREDIQDPTIQGYLEVLEAKAQRLKVLTEDVVEASKASSGNITLACMKLNLAEMVQQTSGEFAEKFEARSLKEVLSLPEVPAFVWADGRRTWRILENIYNNTAKYAMEGTRVYADLRVTDQSVIFSLKNISEQPLNISAEELTERFVRGDVSRSTEGSGLGLAIARDLAQLMQAQFDLYLDGDLFRVTITFPRIKV